MTTFEGLDFYDLDPQLNEDERMVRDMVRSWVDTEIVPIIEEHYLEGSFPKQLLPQLGQLGLLGANLDGYGCANMSNVAYGLICQELERGDSGLRSFVSVHSSLAMFAVHRFGCEAQRKKYLPKMAAAELIGCFGLTEPDHGSNPAGMLSRAVDDGSHYVLSGSKMWITNGSFADVAIVWAKLDETIRGFVVERDDPGFSAPLMKGKHSLRASVTSELVFDDCRIPKDRLLPGAKGLGGPLSCLNNARYGIAWGALGAAMACYRASVDYSLSRLQFGKPIAAFHLVQNKLAWMLREITKGQLLALQAGRLKDAGSVTPEQISLAKMNNVDIALQIARMARELHGANGILADYPVMRHMCNLESIYTYEGTHDIHNLILGRHITGLAAFS